MHFRRMEKGIPVVVFTIPDIHMHTITQEKNLLSCDVFSTYRDGSQYGSNEFCLLDTDTSTWKGIPARHSSGL